MSSKNDVVYPAHPKDQPRVRHDLFGPPLPLTSNSNSSTNFIRTLEELRRSDLAPSAIVDSSTEELFSKLRGGSSGGTGSDSATMLAYVYSYSDGPTDRALAKTIHILAYVNSTLETIQHFLRQTHARGQFCYLGVHRGDGPNAKLLTKPGQLQNSNTFSALLQFLWQSQSVALVRCDNQGRVGVVTPLWPRHRWCEDVTTLKVGSRGSYVGQCFYAQLEQWERWQNQQQQQQQSEANQEKGNDVVSNPHVADFNSNDNDDDVEMWRPQQDDAAGEIDQHLWLPSTNDSYNPTTEVLLSFPKGQSAPQQQFHEDTTAAAADAFYSGLTRELDSRAESRLFHMRAFNGWTKAIQIAEVNPITKKRSSNKQAKMSRLRVLDLACGKGGDLGKWIIHHRGIDNYVGIDVARGSLRDAAKRAQKIGLAKLKRCSFICADLGSDVPGRIGRRRNKLLSWKLTASTALESVPYFEPIQGGGILPTDKFDVISIQFAIHYMMSTRQRARRFFKTVATLLEIGGNLIATTIDARVVLEHLMSLGIDLFALKDTDPPITIQVGNGACRLKFDASIVKRIFESHTNHSNKTDPRNNRMDPVDESYFGLTYTFTLVEGENHAAGVGEAVDLPEWLSPIPLLKALGAEFGLKVEEVENFHEFFSKRSNVTTNAFAQSALYNMHVLARDGSISQDEWDISRLYMTIKFTKVNDVDVSLGDSDEGVSSSSDEEDQAGESDKDKVCTTERPPQPPDPLITVRALSKAKEHFGDAEWEKMSSADKTMALKQFIS